MPSGGFFDPDKLQSEIDVLNDQVNNPNLWDNPDAARALLQKKSGLEKCDGNACKLRKNVITYNSCEKKSDGPLAQGDRNQKRIFPKGVLRTSNKQEVTQ